jgi:cellulose 1,4-beta-cellobiosidase
MAGAAVMFAAAVGLVVSPATANAAVACEVTYTKAWEGGNGFGGNIVIKNTGDPLTNWTLTFPFPGSQQVSHGWNAEWSQSGANVTARNMSYNGTQGTGASWSIGFNGTFSGTSANPTSFAINGTQCNQQNQTPSLVVTPTSVTVPEGGTATYSVRLSSAPSGNVTVASAAGSGDSNITVTGGASLTFTPSNWSTAQNVTLSASQDTDTTNGTRTINVTASGLSSVAVTATEADDDTGNNNGTLVVTPTSVSVAEGGTATDSVRLSTAPSGNVTVTSAAGSGDSDLTVTGGASLTFTTSNWNTTQNVTLSAAQDTDTTNGSRTFSVSATGRPTVSVTATEVDDDTSQAQSLVVSSTSVTVPEGGTGTYTVRLAIAPTGNVTVTNTAGSGDTSITVTGGASLTFTTSNWQTPQTVTLSAAQDSDTTAGTRPITVASSGLTSVTVTATESDDDGGTGGPRVDNPYVGATGYVNPDWSEKAAAEPGGSRIANQSTGVWMDRIAAIGGSASAMSLQEHLDEAVQQDAANGSSALTIQVVIYNLPNRDCSALASNGELKVSENGLNRYKTEYIDPIAAIFNNAAYRNLRIIAVVEIDSLPNLVTNTNLAACAEAQSSGAYVQGVQYALDKLYTVPNVYSYVDAGHHGWLGWDTNFGPSAELFASTVRGTTTGFNSVTGFIVNTANYSALQEPHFTVGGSVNGQQIRQSRWVDWNQYIDELSFAQAFRTRLVSLGFNSNIGMLIDASRNGWGGSARPAGPSTSTDLNTFVNQSKVDRRIHLGNWCNQSGAGLGERPRANPATGIDAYVWIKPPGESDGSSEEIPNNEGKGFDRMCDPTYGGNERNGNNASGALGNAPISGAWFSAQFIQLMQNAYPPLS